MHSYIAIQNTYDIFEMALFCDNTMIDYVSEDKRHTSKLFIPLLDALCSKNNISFSTLSFCTVNCGPGPFSTLRSIIASVNGLHLATNIPLISIDGLDATFLEFYDTQYDYTIVLLNAFNNEVYYLIAQQNKIIRKGYQKIDLFLADIKEQYNNQSIHFVGNGVTLHHDFIKNILYEKATIKNPAPQICSINTIAQMGLHLFLNKQITSHYLMPLHLKKHAVEI